jgi:hypothetical protein
VVVIFALLDQDGALDPLKTKLSVSVVGLVRCSGENFFFFKLLPSFFKKQDPDLKKIRKK